MGPIQSIADLLSMLRRRFFIIAAVLVLGAVVSVMMGMSRPKTYEAGALIQVESPIINGSSDSGGAQAARTIQVIEQQLTTRENLAAVIDRHGLFAEAPGLSMEQKIGLLRTSVSFQSIASANQSSFGTTSVSALLIVVRLGDGEAAARVANDLAQSVLDLSVARQTTRARETLAFFLEEESRVASEINALEAEIESYKRANPVALGSGDADERSGIEADLRRLSQDMLAIEGEKVALERKERLRETDRRQLDSLAAQLEVMTRQSQALQGQIDAMDAKVADTPEVERTLSAYGRRLEQLQSQYDLITARKADAETMMRMEEQSHSEHFSLLERAIVPDYALGGGGKKLALAGTMASLLAGIGLAFLLDLMNPVIRSAEQMQRELDIRPVITLPDLHLAKPHPNLLRRLTQRWAGQA
ncbi:GumC family protein [Gemmobacter denitrificans]|uniref:Wzz/FepE/Etk N-terminal domain-containing protein n=1 Tax=Gemmobacter denitrificans TaxID=3123040 RepID=A0ABU8BSV4_9RHOB